VFHLNIPARILILKYFVVQSPIYTRLTRNPYYGIWGILCFGLCSVLCQGLRCHRVSPLSLDVVISHSTSISISHHEIILLTTHANPVGNCHQQFSQIQPTERLPFTTPILVLLPPALPDTTLQPLDSPAPQSAGNLWDNYNGEAWILFISSTTHMAKKHGKLPDLSRLRTLD